VTEQSSMNDYHFLYI